MLTSSVNVVQSSFPDQDQGEISGLSRSVSNLGSSLGTALVGSVLVAVKLPEGRPFAVALIMMLVFTLIGLVLAVLIPRKPIETTEPASPGAEPAARNRHRDAGPRPPSRQTTHYPHGRRDGPCGVPGQLAARLIREVTLRRAAVRWISAPPGCLWLA